MSWNSEDFTWKFHEIQQISHKIQWISSEIWQISQNPVDFIWNPPTNFTNQIIQEKLFSFMECCGKATSYFHMKSTRLHVKFAGFHEICQISKDQLPGMVSPMFYMVNFISWCPVLQWSWTFLILALGFLLRPWCLWTFEGFALHDYMIFQPLGKPHIKWQYKMADSF